MLVSLGELLFHCVNCHTKIYILGKRVLGGVFMTINTLVFSVQWL